MPKTYGWIGKILRVDLTIAARETLNTARYTDRFIGGRGLAAKTYWDEVPADCGAFDPENKLIFMTGPLTGTTAPSSGRAHLAFKSPKAYTNESYAHSHAGGHWGPELKFAGFDGVIVEGKAQEPVYLWINDGHVKIRDAQSLWGLDTFATQKEIERRHGSKTRSLVIGVAGERLSRNAVILTDTDSAFGDGGPGGVMGSKNLKAIAVRGTGAIPVADPSRLLDATYRISRLITRREGEEEPAYFQRGMGGWAGTKLEEEAIRGDIEIGTAACFACPIACRRSVKFKDGSIPPGTVQCAAMDAYCGPEQRYYGGKYWGRVSFKATQLMNMYGIGAREVQWADASAVDRGGLNWIVDCYQNGVLTEENTDLPLGKFGSEDFIEKYLWKLAYREGVGDVLAEGIPRAAQYIKNHPGEFHLNPEKAARAYEIYQKATDPSMGCYYSRGGRFGGYSMHRWGAIEYPKGVLIHSPVCQIMHATDVRDAGTQHEYTIQMLCQYRPEIPAGSDAWREALETFSEKWFGSRYALQAYSYEHKPEIAIFSQHLAMEKENLILCDWIFPITYSIYTPDHLGDRELSAPSDLFAAVTGIERTRDEMWLASERCWNLERAIACREGRRREDDWLLPGYFDLIDQLGHTIDRQAFSGAMDRYYQLRGWDLETGVPTRAKLEGLDLKDVADELERLGVLPV
ncbi:MAG: aldehyde ferredoxin oxidoreductase N-terminal domain-containing protein [Chloroflexota bacterium]